MAQKRPWHRLGPQHYSRTIDGVTYYAEKPEGSFYWNLSTKAESLGRFSTLALAKRAVEKPPSY